MKKKYSYIKIRLLSLNEGGYHILIQGKLNGKRLFFIVDTGSSRTVLDEDVVNVLCEQSVVKNAEGKAVTLSPKTIDIATVNVDSLSFGKTLIKNYQCVVMDLSGVHNAYSELKLPRIHGIVGGDLLKRCGAVIDYETCRLRLSRQE